MANTDQLKNILQGYVGQLTDQLLNARAQLVLDQYIDAENAYSNLVKGAAAAYSDARGSVTKRAVDDAKETRDNLWNAFVYACALGGVVVPTVDEQSGYWDMGRREY